MGSRFGGLKQLEAVGPAGETLLEYAIHDAVRAGFGRVVFVIREAFAGAFEAGILSRLRARVEVATVYQELDTLPGGFACPAGREKPWGTGHAVWVARARVQGPFAVINADDYYGVDAYAKAVGLLRGPDPAGPPEFGLVAFRLARTLSPHGSVSRGICQVSGAGYLEEVVEKTELIEGAAGPCSREGGELVPLAPETPVSMNFFVFTPALFPLLEARLRSFLEARGGEMKSEFYLPAAVAEMSHAGAARVRVLTSEDDWMGVTYAADKPAVVERLRRLSETGLYPVPLA